jgi:hypothetical protein
MLRAMRTSLVAMFILCLTACGDDSVAHDLAPANDLSSAAGDMAGGAMFTLKLENYLSWCTVSVNSGTSSTSGLQTLSFAPNAVVNLAGDKLTGFEWGYWVGTVGDTTAAHDTAMNTTVQMDKDRTVQACCPFASGPQAHQPCPAP